MPESQAWHVYMLLCADNSLYTGITTDPERRLREHNSGRAGAKYTRPRRPVEMVYLEPAASRADAARREYEIRQLTRSDKQVLIELARLPA